MIRIKKKIIGYILIVTTCLLAGCNRVGMKTPYFNAAEDMYDLVWKLYRVSDHNLFSEYYPQNFRPNLTYFNDGNKNAQEVSFLWPMSGLFTSTVLLAEINPDKYLPYLDSMVSAIELYYDDLRAPPGYQAYPKQFGSVDRYYDDNGLVCIDYIDSYNISKNPLYLERAKNTMAFIMSGWRDDWDGAVSWVEGVQDQKPACTNGMAMVSALKIYEATGDRYYLELGKKFYHWIQKYLFDPENNIIYNSWNTESGEADKTFYTYNTGTSIQGAVRLFKATADKSYLNSARKMAEGSHAFFFKYNDKGVPYAEDIPWFDVVLMRGYQELYEIDGNPKYMNTIVAAIDHAMVYCRDHNGLVYNDWSGKTDEYMKPKWLLDSSCIPEFLVRAGIYKGEKK